MPSERTQQFEDRIAELERRLAEVTLRTDTEALRGHVGHLGIVKANDEDLFRLRTSLDLLKSSLEVPIERIEELERWRAEHPLPAEPLVTVCIATYRRPDLLVERCLESVCAQTYERLEILVVHDGPSPESRAAVAAIGDPRIRYLETPERGAYPRDPHRRWMVAGTTPSNHALSLAGGDLVTHLDDDDEHLPGRVESLLATLGDSGADVVWHPFWQETASGEWELMPANRFAYSEITTGSVLYRSWFASLPWDIDAHRLGEPGDWNRFRRWLYVGARCTRHPESLLRHHRERAQRTS